MTEDDPLGKVKRLRERVESLFKDMHLELVHFVVIPGTNSDPDLIEIGACVPKEALMTLAELEQKDIDETFRSLMSGINEESPKISTKLELLKSEIDAWLEEE